MAKFPKELIVRQDVDGDDVMFIGATKLQRHAEVNEEIPVAYYQLVGTGILKAELKVTKR